MDSDSIRYRLCSEDVAWRVLDHETVLVNLVRQRLHLCNDTATFVVETLRSEPTLEELVQGLCETFEADVETARADVRQLLFTLEQEGVVATKGA
jgi:hypothetical protein